MDLQVSVDLEEVARWAVSSGRLKGLPRTTELRVVHQMMLKNPHMAQRLSMLYLSEIDCPTLPAAVTLMGNRHLQGRRSHHGISTHR